MYDLAIIGAGAAGIAGAKAALRAGLSTVLIDKEKLKAGGTCLNRGCIPTKFFLNASKLHKSWEDCFRQSQKIIEGIKAPLLTFLDKQGIDLVWGQAQFLDKNTLSVAGVKIEAKNIIIAAGSSPASILEHPKAVFADDVFARADIGNKILIIGAGYIGVELASLLNNLGRDVYLIEKEKTILPLFDATLASRLEVLLQKQGIKIDSNKNFNECNLDDFDLIIPAVGRIPNTAGLKIDELGVVRDKKGWIRTDGFMRTSIDNIYACGDITGKKLLAYAAEYQAGICVDNINGKNAQEDYTGFAECVFSIPSAARVGISGEQARKEGIAHRVIKSNFLRFSSSHVYNDTDGFIQIIVDGEDRVIGAGIISQAAAELISIFSFCIKNNLGLAQLKKCTFIHPTLSEIITLLVSEK